MSESMLRGGSEHVFGRLYVWIQLLCKDIWLLEWADSITTVETDKRTHSRHNASSGLVLTDKNSLERVHASGQARPPGWGRLYLPARTTNTILREITHIPPGTIKHVQITTLAVLPRPSHHITANYSSSVLKFSDGWIIKVALRLQHASDKKRCWCI